MTSGDDAVLSRLRRRLERVEGVVNLKTTHTGPDSDSLDFDLGFPEGSMVRISRERSTGIGRSSVILQPDGYVEAFLLRLPPLPADGYPTARLHDSVEEIVGRHFDLSSVDVDIRPGQPGAAFSDPDLPDPNAWWPHVQFRGYGPTEIHGNEFGELVSGIYLDYKSQFFDPSEAGYHR